MEWQRLAKLFLRIVESASISKYLDTDMCDMLVLEDEKHTSCLARRGIWYADLQSLVDFECLEWSEIWSVLLGFAKNCRRLYNFATGIIL